VGGRESQHACITLQLAPAAGAAAAAAAAVPPTGCQPQGAAVVRPLRPSGADARSYSCATRSDEVEATLHALQTSADATHIVEGLEGVIRACMPAQAGARPDPPDPMPVQWCAELEASRDRFRSARRARRAQPDGEALFRAARSEHHRLLRFKKRCQHRAQQHELIQSSYHQPALFWRAVRGNSDRASVPSDMAAWEAHFTSVFSTAASEVPLPPELSPGEVQACTAALLPLPTTAATTALDQLSDPITEGEVSHAISWLRKGKAADSHGFTAECVLLAARTRMQPAANGGSPTPVREHVFVPCLTVLFNLLLQGAPVPRPLTHNTLTPIFKGKGSREVLSGYRGIAVGSIFG